MEPGLNRAEKKLNARYAILGSISPFSSESPSLFGLGTLMSRVSCFGYGMPGVQ